jgi:8-oxo-dGTP pyrophosphatase MutT (NUDIX family)
MADLPAERRFYASLPRKRVAAAALFFDASGQLLLVDPVYQDAWHLPGGLAEPDESPYAACRREVAEELGISPPIGRLLCVDWVPPEDPRTEGLILMFDGGALTAEQIAAITLPPEELAGYAFVPPEEAVRRLPAHLGRRVELCLTARADGTTAYLEHGRNPVR